MGTQLQTSEVAEVDATWNQLIRRHDHGVVVALLARGLPLARARELAQDAWGLIYERWAEGRLSQVELPGLIITQALFLASTERRRARPRLELGEEEWNELVDPAPTAEKRAADRQLVDKALTALESLSPRARSIFLSAYGRSDAPHAQVAAAFGISVQRVRQTLCEVRAKLRRALEEDSRD
jgi:RNA polymerase sigma-70 factor (ECF subfamily)